MAKHIENVVLMCAVFLCAIQLLLNTEVHGDTIEGELDGANVCKVLEKYDELLAYNIIDS